MSTASEAHIPRHRGLAIAAVLLATSLYSIDWTIAAVALPHMQGTFSATSDQIGWVITSYIVASAIALPAGGWLSTRFGRKRVYLGSMISFVSASMVCGAADTLTTEVLARVVQGLSGALLIPLGHAIILDSYRSDEQGTAIALWSIGSVLGSMVGPSIGGYITEYLNWRYIFYINLPLGIVAIIGVLLFVPETERDSGKRLDWFGFLTLALGFGALQMMLDRGVRLDWFESEEILLEACLAGLGLYLYVAHSFTTKKEPFVDLHLLASPGFMLGLIFVFIYGLLTVPPMVLMPTFLDELQGRPIDMVGLLQSPRGVGMFISALLAARLARTVGPRPLLVFGLLCFAISNYEMSRWTTEVGTWPILWTNFVQGLGGGVLYVPIQILSLPGIAQHKRTEAMGIFNLMRSVGSSVGVSLALALLVQASAMNHAQLTEHATPYNRAIHAAGSGWELDSRGGLARAQNEIERQALMLGYSTDFMAGTFVALAGLPFVFMGRRKKVSAQERAELTANTMVAE